MAKKSTFSQQIELSAEEEILKKKNPSKKIKFVYIQLGAIRVLLSPTY